MNNIYLDPMELANVINDECKLQGVDHDEPGPIFIGITNGTY